MFLNIFILGITALTCIKMSEPPKKKAKQQNLFVFLAKALSNKPLKRTDVDVVAEDADDNMLLVDAEAFF